MNHHVLIMETVTVLSLYVITMCNHKKVDKGITVINNTL